MAESTTPSGEPPAPEARSPSHASAEAAGEDSRRAEESLRQSEERYRRLVEASTDILASVDASGRVRLVNRQSVSESGFDPSQIDGRHFTDFLPPGRTRDQGIEAFERLMRGEQQFRYETKALRADGSLIHVHVNAVPVRDPSGAVAEIIVAAADVTEQKRTEDALRENRRRLEEAQRLAEIGSWEWEIEADRISWSDELYRIWDLDPEQFDASYEGYLDRVHPDDRERVDGLVRRALDTLEPLDFEHRIVRADGEARVLWAHGNVVAEEGKPVRMYGTGQDITERKRVEEELRLTRELALGIGEAGTVDEALELVLRKVCEETGWVLGQAWLPSGDRSCLVCGPAWVSGGPELERFRHSSDPVTFARGESIPGRAWAAKAPFWVTDVREDSSSPRADAARAAGIGGGMALPVLAADDVVAVLEFFALGPQERGEQLSQLVSPVAAQLGLLIERRAGEQALRSAHEELQQRSAELARSNLELEQFAYDASHDLGEPLHVMSALADRLLRRHGDALDEEARRIVALIVDGSERMTLLVNDLLEYSRTAREPLVCRPVDCGPLVLETLELLSESISEKKAKVAVDPLPTVQAHPRQLAHVFQNLLSNALKFSADRALRIHVGAEREPGGHRFWVRDNGIGVDPPQAERIFEMFRRLHTRDMYAGTGLGLSICRRIVERHGGRIWVEEAPDEGSVFHFTLPDRPEPEARPK